MKFFKKLDYPEFKNTLISLNALLKNNIVNWGPLNQICINTTGNFPDDYQLGVGSLQYDWKNASKNSNDEIVLQTKSIQLEENNFSVLCNQFKNTEIENIFKFINEKYLVGRIRLIKSSPKTCLSWHRDNEKRLHYVLSTSNGCYMVIEDEVCHMPVDTWWLTETQNYHTAFNASKTPRIHLVASLLN